MKAGLSMLCGSEKRLQCSYLIQMGLADVESQWDWRYLDMFFITENHLMITLCII